MNSIQVSLLDFVVVTPSPIENGLFKIIAGKIKAIREQNGNISI